MLGSRPSTSSAHAVANRAGKGKPQGKRLYLSVTAPSICCAADLALQDDGSDDRTIPSPVIMPNDLTQSQAFAGEYYTAFVSTPFRPCAVRYPVRMVRVAARVLAHSISQWE